MKSRQYVLMILDGVGINEQKSGNAFSLAKKPNLNRLIREYPTARIKTSGLAVGLPDGQMGNSEVGHASIGSGRIILQELTRISKTIEDGSFVENPVLLRALTNVKRNDRSLHLMGLVSDGGVHSHQDHLYALLRLAKRNNIKNVYVHAFLDGRDTLPDKALDFIKQLEMVMTDLGVGQIATIAGRYYGMDRDNRWDRTELAYNAMVQGIGKMSYSAQVAIRESYNTKVFDEFIRPTVIVDTSDKPIATICNNDSVVFFNFRPDRARQITRAIVDEDFNGFGRLTKLSNLNFVTLTDYDSTIKGVEVAFLPQTTNNTFGEYISKLGYKQLRIAETEKYAHVTFFFNGGEEKQYLNENRILVPSPKVATYDLQPEMSAFIVADKVVEAIKSKRYDVIVMNFANGDMVGHTGKMPETIQAVEVLDECVSKIITEVEKSGGEAIITADHGNCEYMFDSKTGATITSHSTFDVPIIVVSNRVKNVKDGRLCDIAPTLLDLMNETIPMEMTGKSIIELKKEKK